MAPQARGIVPPEHLARIEALRKLLADTEQELHQAVADALNAGASIRELAKVTGLSGNTVQAWGRANGWPSEIRQRVKAEKQAARDEFAARIAAAEALLKHLDLPDD
jgi:transposase-like protein